jgi:uncharacterized membrane protein YhaH (DUF805 family)
MPVAKKAKSLMGAARRFELWWIWCALYSIVVLGVLWSVDDWVDNSLARLISCGVLVLGFAVIAVLIRQFYDAEGKRVRVQPLPEPVETDPV